MACSPFSVSVLGWLGALSEDDQMNGTYYVNNSPVRLKCSPTYAGDRTTWLAALQRGSSDPSLQDQLYKVSHLTVRRLFSGDPIPTDADLEAIAMALNTHTGEPKKVLRFFP